jgi:hypothetical protein
MAHGCDEIIFYRREDVPERVRALTGGEGVTTVYDTVGKDTYEGSLKSLKRRGVLVGCGTASGPFPPIDALQLAIQGSVYFTRPALADFIANPAERTELSEALFGHVAAGRIKINVNQRYDLEDAAAGAPRPRSREDDGLVDLRNPMRIDKLTTHIGAELTGVNLAEAATNDDLFGTIREALLTHKVLFLRGQDISKAIMSPSPPASAN